MADEQQKPHDPVLELAAAVNRVFASGDGPAVLEALDRRFRAQRIYQAGGLDGQRETDRRAAQKEVIDWIYAQIFRAQNEVTEE